MLFNVHVKEVICVFRSVGRNYPNSYRSILLGEAKGNCDAAIKTEERGEIIVQG